MRCPFRPFVALKISQYSEYSGLKSVPINRQSKIDSIMAETAKSKIDSIMAETAAETAKSKIDSIMAETGSSKELGIEPYKSAPISCPPVKGLGNTGKRETLIGLTEGFYIGHWRHNQISQYPGNMIELYTDTTDVIEASRMAIDFYNLMKGSNLDFVELVRANKRGSKFYLTIKASDGKFYEAKVYLFRNKFEVFFIRPAVHYPKVNRAFRKYDAPGSSARDYAPLRKAKAKAKK